MALINCPECSKSISDQSTACPSCGFPTARVVPPPLPQADSDNNDSLAGNRQRQKNSGCSGATIFLIIIIVAIGYWLVNSYDNYTDKAKQYSEEQSKSYEESSPQFEDLFLDSELTRIPMLLSGSSGNERYFLISNFTAYDLENIEYVRRGNESDAYGKMQISCINNEIRKSSSENFNALSSADLGDWYTPTPDWTDQDIVNFICKKQSVSKQPQLNTERDAVGEPVSTSETLVSIPMSDSFENGRYFLTSQTTENGVENIEYIREGNDNTSYAKMQIKCSENQIKKYSADNPDALQSAAMGDWITPTPTPTPDWTDQDIVNFICKY